MAEQTQYGFFRDIGLVGDAMKTYLTSNDGQGINTTPLSEIITANKTTLIEIKSIYGLSTLRDKTTLSGTGQVINEIGDREYDVFISGATSSSKLVSLENGRYVAGKAAEYGIGVRLSSATYTGDTIAKWGAIDDDNELCFGQDSGGTFVMITDNGSETKTYQSDWNVDKLNGTGSSGLVLDTTDGQVFNVVYTWYGYGVITFVVYIKDATLGLRRVIVHQEVFDGKTSIQHPNLPIGAKIEQTNTSDTEHIYVGGRQFSILGSYTPSFRETSEYVKDVSVGSTVIIPLISFKKKTTYNVVTSKIQGIDILSDQPLDIEVFVNTTLTGATFGTPTRTSASETAFESDILATSVNISNANLLFRTLTAGGIGNTKSISADDIKELLLNVPNGQIVTLCAISLGGTASVDAVFRLREEW